jgi:hypothetical protein
MSKIKIKERELTITDAVSEAFGELQSLGEEMRESYDNTPESLQSSGVGEARGEAADALENISEPDVPETLGTEVFKFQERALTNKQQMRLSRAARRDNAVAVLQHVVEHLEVAIADTANMNEDEIAEAESLRDDVQNIIDEAEGVEFPGMYG